MAAQTGAEEEARWEEKSELSAEQIAHERQEQRDYERECGLP